MKNTIATETNYSEVGAFIDNAESNYLKGNFKKKYPDENRYVFIPKQVITRVFEENPNCSGIRFTYGLAKSGVAASKLLILVPCIDNQNSTLSPVLHSEGYSTNHGERISLLQAFEFMSNHVLHFKKEDSSLHLRQVPRSCFFGINKLKEIISPKEAEGINYHFGYDIAPEITDNSSRYRIVLEMIYHEGYEGIKIEMDQGGLCPPNCERGDGCLISSIANMQKLETEIIKNKLDLYRQYRDNYLLNNESSEALVEMYYFISPAIVNTINKLPNRDKIYNDIYENEIKLCENLINSGENQKVQHFFERSLNTFISRFALN
jgi:hypothetical protein